MGARVLLCLEDGGVASVVAARLLKDGIDGVVVERPALLVDEARKGVAAVAIQDKYPSGEAGSSLLRQIRVARAGVAAPAVVLVTGDLGLADRHVLERQYKVKSFLPASTNPLTIGEAVRAAAMAGGGMPDEASEDLIVREDPGQSDFEISIESVADDKAFDDAFDEEEATEVNRRTPQMRRAEIRSAPADGTEEREGRAAGDEPEALGANPGETDALPTPGPTAPHETQEGETLSLIHI